MMTETVFFNPGNSLGNFQDYNEAVRSAKIYRQKHNELEDANVIVVNGKHNDSYDIFLKDHAEKNNDDNEPYTIKKQI
ncbi:hypothetical protein [Fructilactobacillus lindneri]|nr:hypothetical protein [Fructilactobacillus lindneri]